MKPDQDRTSDFIDRRAYRYPVGGATTLRGEEDCAFEVRVRDVSPAGFMAECPHMIGIGSAVSLDVPGIGAVKAQIRWQLAGRMGGLFRHPISLAQCEWMAVRSGPAGLTA